ncbi:hypothetical protein [Silvimonas sp.]|uniref:hypothetical protein n=1 Tax=Silvimonas sp. TaxID=2650811 RepID=UPI0028428D93|nr:hypothetical protein [Silvimonas sp.]MDR3429231.1 hypothetical protein [Silvimonas sp.]
MTRTFAQARALKVLATDILTESGALTTCEIHPENGLLAASTEGYILPDALDLLEEKLDAKKMLQGFRDKEIEAEMRQVYAEKAGDGCCSLCDRQFQSK